MNLPEDKQRLLNDITDDLKGIAGVKAIVLGGSYAVGMATKHSDLDIGVYYSKEKPFNIEDIKSVAEKYTAHEAPTVTGFYEWGPWVNGGAWITTSICEVDFLYKNIEQIAATIEQAKNGVWENDFEQQPPYGFSSIIFLAETHGCLPLYDPDEVIKTLKESIVQYPQKLKASMIQQSLWSAEFTIWQAEKFAKKADVYNTVGCLTRAIKNIITALFAINEIYPMGDKRAVELLAQSKFIPVELTNKINDILCCDKNLLNENVRSLNLLFKETCGLADGQYKPYYQLK